MKPTKYFLLILLMMGLVSGQTSKLNIYGYFDIESEVNDKDSRGKIWSFDQHHLNLISIYDFDQNFILFTEMEWEHGPFHSEEQSVGNIYLTRAWLEYKFSDAIKIQTGKLLLPFGIYGVKYDATPTYLTVSLSPAIYGKYTNTAGVQDRLFAKYVTGVQFTGTSILKNWSLEYFINLSNGRGPTASEEDTNVNKALGARIFIQSPEDVIKTGLSYYSDRDGNSNNIQQNVFGIDFQLTVGESSLSSELIIVEDETLTPDLKLSGKYRQRMGSYLQYAYSLGDLVTPYVRVESFKPEENRPLWEDKNIIMGINYSITSRIYLKGDFSKIAFSGESLKNYQQIALALTVAF